ncbi:site-2 protease family protein [Streptomyces spectabilis]|uniref:Peptidase n=1 Tax=Streptomyces spectabilis TaxID=68270 RepID=A0A516R4L0_STRST|nr:site-2 protease family protein [Streptomyces spectabilis]QDQ10591.1 peptidase [Streptomyces spectabilis]
MDESGGSGRPQSDSTPERDPAGAHPARPEADGPGPEPTPGPTAGPPERMPDGQAPNTDDEPPSPSTDGTPTELPTDGTPTDPTKQTAPHPAAPEPATTPSEPGTATAPEPATPEPGPARDSEPAAPEPATTPSEPTAPQLSKPATPDQGPAQSAEPGSAASGAAAPEPRTATAPEPVPVKTEDRPRVDTAKPRPAASSGRTGGDPAKEPPKNPGGGLLMGRPFGVPVYVAPSWFLVAALITWVFGDQLDRVLPELGGARYLVSLFFAVAFYASVLVHELAHTVAALRFKLPVRRIQLQFFGGVSEIEKESETPGREFVLAFVGPLLSLVLAGVFYVAMRAVEPDTVPGVLLAGLMISNLIVAVFNLLPGLPLDGGRMLRAVVWKITGRPMSGTVAAAWVGRALAISVLVGLPVLNQSGALGGDAQDLGGMDTVTDALLAAILAAIIWTGAGNSLRMARLREHLPELRARALTRRAVPVETDTPLSEALRRANAAGARALVVVDTDGDPLAVVREAAIVGVPEHRRPWVTVSGLAQDITEGMRVPADLAGEELLDRLRATPATEYLVVEPSGEIYGVLSAADVERAFVKAMARPT